MLGYAVRVATRFDGGFNTRAPSTAFRRSLNHADRDARHRCHGGQAGHADGVPTNNRSATRPDLALSACVQKSKPAMESLGNTGPSASDLGQVLSVTPCSHPRGRTPPPDSSAVTSPTHCKPAHRRVNEMQPSQSAAAKAAPTSGTVTSGQNPVTFCGPRAQAEEHPHRGTGAVIARSPGNRHLHRQYFRLLSCGASAAADVLLCRQVGSAVTCSSSGRVPRTTRQGRLNPLA
jgi:hypothetical protein